MKSGTYRIYIHCQTIANLLSKYEKYEFFFTISHFFIAN